MKQGKLNITRDELCRFVIQNIYDIAAEHGAKLIVLWVPKRKDAVFRISHAPQDLLVTIFHS